MTAKEKEEIKARIYRAEQLERRLEIVTDALAAIQYPEIGKGNGADPVWIAIERMPKEYRDAIAVVVKKWGESINEEYKKL